MPESTLTPSSHQLESFFAQGDSITDATAAFNYLDHSLGEMLGRGLLPGVPLEPITVVRKALGGKERSSQLDLARTGELEMMGQLMDEGVAQSGCRSRSQQDNEGALRVISAAVAAQVRLRGQHHGADAGSLRRECFEEVGEGLSGQLADIFRDIFAEAKNRLGGAA